MLCPVTPEGKVLPPSARITMTEAALQTLRRLLVSRVRDLLADAGVPARLPDAAARGPACDCGGCRHRSRAVRVSGVGRPAVP